MKKLLVAIIIFAIYTIGYQTGPKAQDLAVTTTPEEKQTILEIPGRPDSILVSAALNNLIINFDISSILENQKVTSARLTFSQDNPGEEGYIFYLRDSETNFILDTVSAFDEGDKIFEEVIFDRIVETEGKNLAFKIELNGIDENSVMNLSDIKLEIEYEEVDIVAPEIIAPQLEELTDTTAKFIWRMPENVVSFIEYGKTSSYGNSKEVDRKIKLEPEEIEDEFEGFQYQATLTNLIPGNTYHYQIVAVDESGNREVSGNNTFVTNLTADDTQILGLNETDSPVVGSLVGTLTRELDAYSINLFWEVVGNTLPEKFVVYRRFNGENFEKFAELEPGARNFFDQSVVEGNTYEYILRTIDGADISPPSETISILVDQKNLSEVNEEVFLGQTVDDLRKIVLFTMSVTGAIMAILYIVWKYFSRFFAEVFSLKNSKNLFRDPEFIKSEFDKSSKKKGLD